MTTPTTATGALLFLLRLAPHFLSGGHLLLSSASFLCAPPPTRTREVRAAFGRPPRAFPPINGDDVSEEEEQRDLFEYFDPRLSPHEYPDGIRDDASSLPAPTDGGDGPDDEEDGDEDGWDPLRLSMNSDFTSSFDRRTTTTDDVGTAVAGRARDDERPIDDEEEAGGGGGAKDLFDVFDPRLSPHEYPRGIPDCSSSSSSSTTAPSDSDREATYAAFSSTSVKRFRSSSSAAADRRSTTTTEEEVVERVGVLLIDHGSKRESANENLRALAREYDERSPRHYVVRAAHMEICEPGVEEGLRVLLEEERVDKIVCHPYFLSPGKHATEDVPSLVADAMAKLDRPDVPIVTTEPVGSRIDVMIGAIQAVVDRTLLDFAEEEEEGVDDERRATDERL